MSKEKTYQQMRNEFQEAYYKTLVPSLSKQEGDRIRTLIITLIISSIFLFLGLFIIFGCIISDAEFDKATMQSIALMFGLSYGTYYVSKKHFESKIKKKVMPTVCKCFGNLKWKEATYGGKKNFSAANLIPEYNDDEYDDIFYGKYKDVKFQIIECEFTRGSGKNRTTIFNGAIIRIPMNKNFNGNTVIKPDSIFHKSPSQELRHTVLEDVVFEKKFDVFTDDEVEARYLITTAFMERLNNMKTAFKADKVSCAFYQDELLIALHTNKDLFSLGSLIRPVADGKQFFQMFEEILSIIKLIDHFKLDQKIGM